MNLLKTLDNYVIELSGQFLERDKAAGLLGSISYQFLGEFPPEKENQSERQKAERERWIKAYIKSELSAIVKFSVLYKRDAVEVLSHLDKTYPLLFKNGRYLSGIKLESRVEHYRRVNGNVPSLYLLKKFITWSIADTHWKPEVPKRNSKPSAKKLFKEA